MFPFVFDTAVLISVRLQYMDHNCFHRSAVWLRMIRRLFHIDRSLERVTAVVIFNVDGPFGPRTACRFCPSNEVATDSPVILFEFDGRTSCSGQDQVDLWAPERQMAESAGRIISQSGLGIFDS